MRSDTMNDSTIYPRQLAVLIFFVSIAFKVVMLPKYLAMIAPRDFVASGIVVMLGEVAMYLLVYYVIVHMPLANMSSWARRLASLLILISTSTKFVVLSVETLGYISTMLFKEGRWLFIILTLFPVIGYVAYRGANTIARVSEILAWAVAGTILFSILFMRVDMDITALLPLFDSGIGASIEAYDLHSMWLGDALPFLALSIAHSDRRIDRYAPYVGLAITYTAIVGFFVLFMVIYGDVAPYISYAFSNIAIYNSISDLLGGVEFPIVCVWLLVAMIKLSFMLYAMVQAVENILPIRSHKGHVAVLSALSIALMLILAFGVEGVGDMYAFATSYVRYIVVAIDYTLPIVLALVAMNKQRKHSTAIT